ncbi:YolD-like family protein [Listeria ilorinensis]|uniref:YolD-like family protein n=1 Tax=Listeria ilorinensis TaxID=2867439 RepID=UPI001EF65027|nr:YolD-like family protein [Listeria ilorinensis]
MVLALKKTGEKRIDPARLEKHPIVDPAEQESFYITLKDAIKREWFVRVRYFQEADLNQLVLAPFEYPEVYQGMGQIEKLDVVPLEMDIVTQEILFKDVFGTIYPIQFNDLVDIELL